MFRIYSCKIHYGFATGALFHFRPNASFCVYATDGTTLEDRCLFYKIEINFVNNFI